MLKKLLVGLISLNICFSSLAYAQYQPVEELTAEEVEMYMSSVEKKEKGLPTSVKVAGGAAAVLTLAYVVKKIAKNPELGALYVAAQDPKAYSILMRHAEKKAVGSTAKGLVRAEAKAEMEAMQGYSRDILKRHRGRISKINRSNYFKWKVDQLTNPKIPFVKNPAKINRAKYYQARYNKGKAWVTASYSKGGRVFKMAKKAGKWGLLIGLTAYVIFGDNNKEETAISNNRMQLEREIRKVMREDVDSIALFIYNLPEDQQQVAYGILSENPAVFNAVKKQIEEAFSAANIQAAEEYYGAVDEVVKSEELNSSITDTLNSGAWNYDLPF